ncbi:MAG: Ice-binding protein [Mycobacterium sp.]|nr:Ice-binding protein [Mycobacterium sp.]
MTRIRPDAARISLALGIVTALMVASAWGYWSPGPGSGGEGASSAATITQGATPTASATGGSVTVSWAASNVTIGHPATGYAVKRFDATTLVAQTILTNCTGTVAATTCTESSVPSGQWKYSITPKLGTFWTGPESLKSNTVTIDSTAPVNVITATAGTGDVFKSSNTVYYRGADAGSFTLTNTLTDSESGPASSTTAILGATSTGWTHTPSTVAAPTGGPYVSEVFSWASSTTSSPTELVTGRDAAGNTAATSLTYVNDSTPPGGGSVAYTNGYQSDQSVVVTFSAGTDSGSGVATHQLQRSEAAMVAGNCGTFTSFANVGVDSTSSPYTDTVVQNQYCYQYRYVVTDNLGNQGIAATTNVAKVDTSAGGPALGYAGTFSVLGGTGVTSSGATVVSGDLGVSPSASVAGFPPGVVGGSIHAGDAAAATAQSSLVAAYDDAAARAPTDTIAGDLGGLTFGAGVHHAAGAVTVTGTVTLDGQDDPNSVFIFQLGAALATAAASHVTLINGAQAGHVFWQVTGAVGTGASSFFTGTIMAAGAITLGASAQLLGRALGYGTVTLSANTLRFSSTTPPSVTITGGASVDTWDTTPTISGTTDATPGLTVTVTVGSQSLPTTVQSDGSWSVTAAALTAGTYNAVASVRSSAGDAGTASQTVIVEVNPDPPVLGAVASFSVLGGTGVSNTGSTVVSGDLGVSPSTSVVGFPPGTVGGTIHPGDAAAGSAQSALVAAYNGAAAQTPTDSFAGEMGGLTFNDGVHHASAAISLTGTVTLDGRGDPDAVFIFQLSAALATAAASHVTLINGAQAANVYWQVNGAVGTGASSFFAGTLMASGAITLGANTQLLGRALGYGTVTLSTNAVRFTSALPPTVTITGGATAVTASTTPTISGTTDAGVGVTVTVRVAEQTLTTTVQSDGSWSVTTAALTGGSHDVVASARDAAGNAASATQSLTVEINPDPPALGAVSTYSVFGGSGVSNSGATALSGDLGATASGTIAGFPPGTAGGTIHAGDSAAESAQSALVTAYNDVAGRTPSDSFAGEIGGLTFHDGVHYAAAAISLTGTVTLDGRGDPNATFFFQVNAAMATAAASHVTLINGAQASHVFWQVSGAFGTGASATFTGTVMAAGAITLGAGATLDGRALSYGLVTLSTNTVTTS